MGLGAPGVSYARPSLKEEAVGATVHPQFDSSQRVTGEYRRADWDGLYARNAPSLYRRVVGIVRNPEDAEDALAVSVEGLGEPASKSGGRKQAPLKCSTYMGM